MRANLSVTDGVYGVLSGMDVREQIGNLGQETQSFMTNDEIEELVVQTKKLLEKLG